MQFHTRLQFDLDTKWTEWALYSKICLVINVPYVVPVAIGMKMAWELTEQIVAFKISHIDRSFYNNIYKSASMVSIN